MEQLHLGDILKIEKIEHPVLVATIRGYKKVDRLPISEMMNISDAVQGIFEYI